MATTIDLSDSLIPRSINRNDTIYVDVNPRVGSNKYPELLYDEVAVIQGSLINLLQCPIGNRGPIFNPEYGAAHFTTLQEPLVPITAMTLRAQVIQTVERWEPRISLILDQTSVTIDYNVPGYRLNLAFTVKVSKRVGRLVYNMPVLSS